MLVEYPNKVYLKEYCQAPEQGARQRKATTNRQLHPGRRISTKPRSTDWKRQELKKKKQMFISFKSFQTVLTKLKTKNKPRVKVYQ